MKSSTCAKKPRVLVPQTRPALLWELFLGSETGGLAGAHEGSPSPLRPQVPWCGMMPFNGTERGGKPRYMTLPLLGRFLSGTVTAAERGSTRGPPSQEAHVHPSPTTESTQALVGWILRAVLALELTKALPRMLSLPPLWVDSKGAPHSCPER